MDSAADRVPKDYVGTQRQTEAKIWYHAQQWKAREQQRYMAANDILAHLESAGLGLPTQSNGPEVINPMILLVT